MSQEITTADQGTLIIPGAYPSISYQSTPVGIAVDGNIVIFGEADGGPSFYSQDLVDVFFTPDQAQQVQATYISGPIVDAFRAYANPSADPDIVGSANRIYIAKTNTSTAASAVIASSYGNLSDSNFGVRGNSYLYQITATAAEMAPVLTSGVIAAFGAPLNGLSFSIRLNGSAATVITLSGTSSDHDTAAHLATELNGQLPSGIVASAGSLTGTIVLTVTADAGALAKHWGKSFELIDSTPGDLAALSLAAGLYVSSQEPAEEIQVSNALTGLNQTVNANASVAMTMGYFGTTALLTINNSTQMLTTTVTGGSGANLSIDLSQYATLSALVTFINSQAGYSASVIPAFQQASPSTLDAQASLPIASGEAGVQPGRLKNALGNFKQAIGKTPLLFTATATGGLPNVMAVPQFLSGGARGGTLAVDIVNALEAIGGININMVVPLFSQDASLDIAAGITAPSSTYTIDAIHALVKSHVLEFSTPQLKANRIGLLSYQGTYAAAKVKAQTAGIFRLTMSCQPCMQVNSVGTVVTFQPWYGAVIASGMQAAGFYKSICNKAANIISFIDPSGYDSGNPGDVEDALESGLLVLSSDTTRNYWVSDQTTFGFDNNVVLNSLQAVYLSDVIVLDLTNSLQVQFVGKSTGDVNEAVVAAFIAQKMSNYKAQKAIVGTNNNPQGYAGLKVNIKAPALYVSVLIIIASAIYFIPISVEIDTLGNDPVPVAQ